MLGIHGMIGYIFDILIYFDGRYHVYVDGFLKTTVRASDKTRALVEGDISS